MIHLKCTAVHDANLNSSSINKPYLRPLNMLFRFFDLLIKTIIFYINFPNSFQDVVYYRILDTVILKWLSLEYKAKFEKKASLI